MDSANPVYRLAAAISGGIPDRVPVVPKIWVDAAASLTGTSLRDVIEGPATALRVMVDAGVDLGVDAVRQFHFPARRTRQEGARVFEVDARGKRIGEIDMEGGLVTHLDDHREFKLEDPCRMAYHSFWAAPEPLVRSIADAERIAVPDRRFYEEDGCGDRERELMLQKGGRLALIGDCGSGTLAFLVCMRGMQEAMCDLVENPRLVHKTIEKGVAIAIERGKFNLDLGLKVLRLNDSVANMSVISPRHWREFVGPHLGEVCDELHHYDPQARIYCHICGNILPIIDDLVATGVDCIGPLDPLGGFTCAQVRERVKDRVGLMGGVNTLSFVNSTPGEILEEAAECIRGAGASGGYVLGSGCAVPRLAKRENLAALVDAAKHYGRYGPAGLLAPC